MELDHLTPNDLKRGMMARELITREGLSEFIRQFWGDTVPQKLVWNWHIDAMCEYLEAVALGDISRLVINVPPGTGKSQVVGTLWPAWLWTLDPSIQFIAGSFDQSLLNNQSERMVNVLQSKLYRAAYPEVQLASDNPGMREFKLTTGGYRFNTSPEGKGTGRHADGAIIDDPQKPQDAILGREAAFKKIHTWFDGTLQTRVRKWIVLIMQRLHTDDLAGRCIEEGYTSLILPMRMTKRAMWARDPRTEVGQLLWPELFPEERVQRLEDKLRGEASAQLQQDPTPATGGFIEEAWTRLEWIEPPTKGVFVQSWDFSSKSAQESHSKVSGQLWCKCRGRDLAGGFVREYLSSLDDRLAKLKGCLQDLILRKMPDDAELYLLLDFVGGHWNFVTSKAQFRIAQDRPLWQKARIKLIEAKANGIPLIEEFKDAFVGIKAIEPEGDKEERLRVHTEKWEAMQVIYPPGLMYHSSNRPGNQRYLLRADEVREEHVKFPRYTWDDHTDTSTQALDRLCNGATAYRENLRKIADRSRM